MDPLVICCSLFPALSSLAPDWGPRVGPGSSISVLGAVGSAYGSSLLCLLCSWDNTLLMKAQPALGSLLACPPLWVSLVLAAP